VCFFLCQILILAEVPGVSSAIKKTKFEENLNFKLKNLFFLANVSLGILMGSLKNN